MWQSKFNLYFLYNKKKLEIWDKEPFVELDIKDLMSTSREYA